MIPVIYTSPGCGPCVATKKWLQSNNIIYEERQAHDNLDELRALGLSSVPVVVYRDHVIVGFDIKKLKEVFPE